MTSDPYSLSQDQTEQNLPGEIIVGNSYRIKGLLGQGGMGTVYRAEHIIIGKEFALKMLSPEKVTQENWNRFLAEGKSISMLDNEHIVKIFNMGIDKTGVPFYVMELLDGFSLQDLIKTRQVPDLQGVLGIFIQTASALNYAHSKGIIHRDVKPSNIMLLDPGMRSAKAGILTPSHHAMLVDFGTAKVLTLTGIERQSLTAGGQVFGTPFYMSPEQCVGERLDNRSDMYSFGCALFETLCGRPPFVGSSAMETVLMHLQHSPPTLTEASGNVYSAELEALVHRLLQKNRDFRYQNMGQVQQELERISRNKSIAATAKAIGFEKRQEETTHTVTTHTNKAIGKPGFLGKTNAYTASAIILLAVLMTIRLLLQLQTVYSPNGSEKHHNATVQSSAPASISNGESEESPPEPSQKQLRELSLYIDSGKKIEITISKDLKTNIIHCPPFQIGEFRFTSTNENCTEAYISKDGVKAKGEVTVPSNFSIILKLGRSDANLVWSRPEVLKCFGPAVISGISLQSNSYRAYGDEILKSIASWKHLKFVELDEVGLAEEGLKAVDAHPELIYFSCHGTTISAEQLARCTFPKRVIFIRLKHFQNLDALFKSFDTDTKLRTLYLRSCGTILSPASTNALEQCNNLSFIELYDCVVDDRLLRAINRNPNIKRLRIWRCKGLTDQCISTIAHKRKDLSIDMKVPIEEADLYKSRLKSTPTLSLKFVE